MKYVFMSVLFLFSNEILSLLALLIMGVMFIGDILTARTGG